MSTIPLFELQHRLAKRNAEKQRAREDELETLLAETKVLREQVQSLMHEIKNLRFCMQKQTDINGQFVDWVIERTSP